MGDGYDVIVGGIDQQQLKDFSLERRDRVAIRQIRERGALVNIQTGAGEPPQVGWIITKRYPSPRPDGYRRLNPSYEKRLGGLPWSTAFPCIGLCPR